MKNLNVSKIKNFFYFLILISSILISILILTVSLSWIGYWFKSFYKIPSIELTASLLGSLSGGIIGGAGTIIAVFFSVQKTNEVQRLHKEELRYKENKDFANKIMKIVARYSTCIQKCCNSYELRNDYDKKLEHWENELSKIQNNHQNNIDSAKKQRIYNIQNNIDNIKIKLDKLNLDRTIAIECYYLLKMKLYKNSFANDLLKHLEIVHNEIESTKSKDFSNDIKRLNELTIDFCKKTINQ